MNRPSRRDFGKQTLGSLLTFSLLESLFSRDAFAKEIKPVTAAWLADLHELGLSVKGKKIKQVDWQKKIETLLDEVDLPELLKFVDFQKLSTNFAFRDRGETSAYALGFSVCPVP